MPEHQFTTRTHASLTRDDHRVEAAIAPYQDSPTGAALLLAQNGRLEFAVQTAGGQEMGVQMQEGIGHECEGLGVAEERRYVSITIPFRIFSHALNDRNLVRFAAAKYVRNFGRSLFGGKLKVSARVARDTRSRSGLSLFLQLDDNQPFVVRPRADDEDVIGLGRPNEVWVPRGAVDLDDVIDEAFANRRRQMLSDRAQS